ncbi:MAG: acyl-CoA thioesterase [Betaproteobacteria bacterium]|nr:acyl-CoA thioesterase [Betaproteobacteria bacterium]MDH5220673.1 acyl-CoA thioesterase [Betaproteobacteria bacterium]MDH5351355.1 acyl-CoA thioesterase [Betaproteobacteria bacterium]
MARTFATERKIRFSHCDPAGIVYFVNFFDMVNGIVEDWFAGAVGFDFEELHIQRRVGFPIVNTGCEFFRPCHLGDRLELELQIARLGNSSIEFAVTGRVGGDEKFRARHKVALMSLDSQRAMPIPQDMREKMRPYVKEAA